MRGDMATLKDIRDFVKRNLDYTPTSTDFDKTLNQLINVQYMDLFTAKPYNFAQKEAKVKVYKDIETTNASINLVTKLITVPGASEDFPTWCEGQVASVNHGTLEEEIELTYRVDADNAYYKGDLTSVAGTKTITIKNRYIDLPEDCVEVLNVSRRSLEITANNTGMYQAISRYQEEWHNLPLDETGEPYYWVYHDEAHIEAPRFLTVAATVSGAGHGVRTLQISGAFVYRGANSDDYGKRYSGVSPETTITLADNQILQVSFTGNYSAEGFYKTVYFRNEENGWYNTRILDLKVPTTFTATYPLELSELQSNDVQVNYAKPPENGGNTKRIRLYQRQDEDYELSVRYVYRPKNMNEDQDTVEIPSSHAIYAIGYAVLENMAMNTDNDQRSVYYQKKKEQALDELDSHFLTSQARRYVKSYMSNKRLPPIYTKLTRTP